MARVQWGDEVVPRLRTEGGQAGRGPLSAKGGQTGRGLLKREDLGKRAGCRPILWWHQALLFVLLCVSLGSMGCTGPEERGDRAMAVGDTERAMAYYERAIEDGSRDPEVYFRAAQAAQTQGAFAVAERYYSQSLRYGGGKEVARALAEFYINTSNFSQAARVYQYLARTADDIQPLYTNIGTALMYAGKYFDAESYLLLAHQMAPEEPVPYINLGVLYDRHLRNRPRAVRFYECYVEMSDDANQVRMVRTRLQEIENAGPVDTSRVHLECGEEYRIHHQEEHDLAEVFDIDVDASEEEGMSDEESEDGQLGEVVRNLPLAFEPVLDEEEGTQEEYDEEEGPEPIVDRPLADGQATTDGEGGVEAARQMFEAGRYDDVVEKLEAVITNPKEQIDEKRLLGKSYYQIGRFEEAARTLELVLEERPRPQVAEKLLKVYDQVGDEEKKTKLCERFSGWPDYEEALASCD